MWPNEGFIKLIHRVRSERSSDNSKWSNMHDVNQTVTSEQGWRRKEPTPRHKQSTNAK